KADGRLERVRVRQMPLRGDLQRASSVVTVEDAGAVGHERRGGSSRGEVFVLLEAPVEPGRRIAARPRGHTAAHEGGAAQNSIALVHRDGSAAAAARSVAAAHAGGPEEDTARDSRVDARDVQAEMIADHLEEPPQP